MAMQLFDSLTRSVKEIVPAQGGPYRFYCCGPTVYGPSHIGNFRTFVLTDVLRRTLEASGMQVKHVRNVTDVDDKTIRESRAAGQSLREFTAHWTERFHADAAELNLLPPHVEPAATGHIEEQIRLVGRLIDRGHAYATPQGSVYFRVSSFDDYGRLSRLKEREITTDASDRARSGAAGDSAPVDADEYERDSAADFALWKARKPEDGDVFWKSPWGEGRPGWHLECSAMSMAYLGESFDLHGGGSDLIFPHHENEIAQSEACTHKPFARHWFHTAHLMVEGSKMSKSLGNLYTLQDVKAMGFSPEALRYELFSGHYRQPLNFTWESLKSAESALAKLRKFHDSLAARAELSGEAASQPAAPQQRGDDTFASFWQALRDDLNTPAALGALFRTIKQLEAEPLDGRSRARTALGELNRVLFALGVHFPLQESLEVPPEVAELADRRWQAKKSRDFATADRLREELKQKGWSVLDRKDGYELEPGKPE